MITKRARLQFQLIASAGQSSTLCLAECYNLKTEKKEYVLCAHHLENGVSYYEPLAKLFKGNPFNEITPPGAAKYKLI